ncbi:hypothetical protein CKQ87_28230, partial [Klebsiella pneumoniae]
TMATFHISFKKLRRSEGKSSVYLSAYQNREKTKDNRTGATWDYSKKEGFFGSAILSPAGTPAELVKDSGTLWNAVEAGEKRKDAELCRYLGHSHPQGAGRRPEEADRPRLLPRKFRGLWNDCRHSIS